MATGKIQAHMDGMRLKAGVNTVQKCILAGYSTGSGNYVTCYLPCDTSAITSAAVRLGSEGANVYLPNGAAALPANLNASEVVIGGMGLRIEFPQSSTQTPNVAATVLIPTLYVTCA